MLYHESGMHSLYQPKEDCPVSVHDNKLHLVMALQFGSFRRF